MKPDTNVETSDFLSINAGRLITDAQITTKHYIQGETATLNLILDSKDISLYGRIQATETLRMKGDLLVTNDGLTFDAGDTFDLFDAEDFIGSFSKVLLPKLPDALSWNRDELYTNGIIRVQASTMGENTGSLIRNASNFQNNLSPAFTIIAEQYEINTFYINNETSFQLFAEQSNNDQAMDITWQIPYVFEAYANDDDNYVLNPSNALPGVYSVRASATSREGQSFTEYLHLKMTQGNTHHKDNIDTDKDYVPDHEDKHHQPHKLQMTNSLSDSTFVESDQGNSLKLGVEAIATGIGVLMNIEQVSQLVKNETPIFSHNELLAYSFPSNDTSQHAFYSLEIHHLAEPGNLASLAIPINSPTQGQVKVLVFQNGHWYEFSENATDSLSWFTYHEAEQCPSPISEKYDNEYQPGANCVLIKVTDGELNDNDGLADGKITLFLAINQSVPLPESTQETNDNQGSLETKTDDNSTGSGTVGWKIMLLLLCQMIWRVGFRHANSTSSINTKLR